MKSMRGLNAKCSEQLSSYVHCTQVWTKFGIQDRIEKGQKLNSCGCPSKRIFTSKRRTTQLFSKNNFWQWPSERTGLWVKQNRVRIGHPITSLPTRRNFGHKTQKKPNKNGTDRNLWWQDINKVSFSSKGVCCIYRGTNIFLNGRIFWPSSMNI
jgi:hypothetical protein